MLGEKACIGRSFRTVVGIIMLVLLLAGGVEAGYTIKRKKKTISKQDGDIILGIIGVILILLASGQASARYVSASNVPQYSTSFYFGGCDQYGGAGCGFDAYTLSNSFVTIPEHLTGSVRIVTVISTSNYYDGNWYVWSGGGNQVYLNGGAYGYLHEWYAFGCYCDGQHPGEGTLTYTQDFNNIDWAANTTIRAYGTAEGRIEYWYPHHIDYPANSGTIYIEFGNYTDQFNNTNTILFSSTTNKDDIITSSPTYQSFYANTFEATPPGSIGPYTLKIYYPDSSFCCSIFLNPGETGPGYSRYQQNPIQFWGVYPTGTYTFKIIDNGNNSSVIASATIQIGTGTPPPPPINSTFGTPDSNPYVPFSYEPVNLATGNYIYQYQDIFIPGRGLPLAISRSYNSMENNDGAFGYGWTFNYNINLTNTSNGDVVIKREDGRRDFYKLNLDQSYTPPLGVYDNLVKNPDGTYTLLKKDQTKYNFTSQGLLAKIIDRSNNQLTFSYSGNNLTQVTDSSGRNLNFVYSNGHIVQIIDPLGRSWNYVYDNNSDLVKYINPMNGQYSYNYSNHWMNAIFDPVGNKIMNNTYSPDGRVIVQSNALGGAFNFSYNATNRRTVVTDPLGRNTTYNYSISYYELNETDASGNTTSYTYDGNGNRNSTTDAKGHTTNYVYDANGNIIKTIDPSGNITILGYDAKNNLINRTDELGRQTRFEYDSNSNLVKTTNTVGNVTTLTYDQYGQLTNTTDINGNTKSFIYDNYGNQIVTIDALNNTKKSSYDVAGRLINTTDAIGNTYRFSYDNLNHLILSIDPLENNESYTYDANGNKISLIDANGLTTEYSYNALNKLMSVTDAMGGNVTYNYDVLGNTISMVDANGHITNYTYDSLDRLSSVTDPLGYTTSYGYDAVGNKISQIDPNGNTTYYNYDNLSRVVKISYPNNTFVNYYYDAAGNRLAMLDNHGNTNYTYDNLNRLTSVTNSDNQSVSYGYDGVGNRIKIIYPDGKIIFYTYNALNNLINVTDWSGNTTNYSYDADGNLVQMSYPNGVEADYFYDNNSRLVKLINKNQSQILSSYEYTLDAVGNRIKAKESSENITATLVTNLTVFARGADNAVWCINGTPGNWNSWQSLGGIVTSNISATSSGSNITIFARGTDNGLWTQTWNGSGWSGWQNLGGIVTSDPASVSSTSQTFVFVRGTDNAVWYQNENINAVNAWSGWQSLGGVVTSNISSSSDTGGNITLFVAGTDNGLWTQNWNGSGWSGWQSLGGVVTSDPASVSSASQTFVFVRGTDNAVWYQNENINTVNAWSGWQSLGGSIIGKPQVISIDYYSDDSQAGENTVYIEYQYDKLYRLTKVTYPLSNISYNYDSMGNRVSMTTTIGSTSDTINYTYDAADRLLQAGNTNYSYDNNGNLIKKNESGNITSYSYNGADRLISISTSFGSQSTMSNFTYDGDGNRISEVITDNNGTRLSKYVLDINSVLPQVLTKSDANGTTIYDYGIDLISMTDPVKGQFYYHYDGLGSVRSLSDNSGGIKATYSYDAFGQPSLMSGSIDNDFLFTGEQMDKETGLIYLRARYYDPSIGRFITRDPFPPIGTMTQDINRYTYAHNNPVRFVDPSGLEVGFLESMIPVWGPGRQAIEDFQGGRWGWGLFNTAMAVSDIIPAKALAGAVGKVGVRQLLKSGSHTWPATSKWLTRTGWREFSGQEMHHWAIPQGRWGKNVPDAIKNQPWNLMGMPSDPMFHDALHGGGKMNMNDLERVWYGTPDWFKAGTFSTVGRAVNVARDAAGDK